MSSATLFTVRRHSRMSSVPRTVPLESTGTRPPIGWASTSSPPGRRALWILRRAFTTLSSGSHHKDQPQRAMSNRWRGASNSSAPATAKVTRERAAGARRDRASSTASSSGSKANTSAALDAANSVSRPRPQPTSSTRLPLKSTSSEIARVSTPSASRTHTALLLRLVRLDGRAVGAELDRLLPRVLELRAHVSRDQVAGFDPLEPVPLQNLLVLCFQQSSGNSAGPEVDVAAALLADGILNRHVCELHSSAGPQHAKDLCEDSVLVRNEIDDAVGDDNVDARVAERKVLDLTLDELDVFGPQLFRSRPGSRQHLQRHVDPGDVAVGPDHLSGDE